MRGRSKRWLIMAAIVLSVLADGGPRAQEVDHTALPYDAQMLRLSEILGALHYLRQLCSSGDGGAWRNQMERLLESEQPDNVRRARMVDRFNRGYESFRSVYRSCTPSAVLAVDRYMDEGLRIAADIVARYGETDG